MWQLKKVSKNNKMFRNHVLVGKMETMVSDSSLTISVIDCLTHSRCQEAMLSLSAYQWENLG